MDGTIYNMYMPGRGIGVDLLVILCIFINNTAGGSGGAIFKTGNNGIIVIDDNSYNNNVAYSFGGAVYVNGTLFFSQCNQ